MEEVVKELVCKNCGSKDFLEGPHGGLAVNVKCIKCEKTMNVCPLPSGFWIIEKF